MPSLRAPVPGPRRSLRRATAMIKSLYPKGYCKTTGAAPGLVLGLLPGPHPRMIRIQTAATSPRGRMEGPAGRASKGNKSPIRTESKEPYRSDPNRPDNRLALRACSNDRNVPTNAHAGSWTQVAGTSNKPSRRAPLPSAHQSPSISQHASRVARALVPVLVPRQ